MNVEQIKKVVVIGAGFMGPGIALAYALGGYETVIIAVDDTFKAGAEGSVARSLKVLQEEGKLDEAGVAAVNGRLSVSLDFDGHVKDADIVVEVITERKDAKKGLYEQIDGIAKPDAIICSNTSSLNIFELMPERRQPYSVITHWFGPAHIIPLVEVVKGPETLEEVMDVTQKVLDGAGKVTVRLEKYYPRFLVNTIQWAEEEAMNRLVDDGVCTPEQLDIAVKASLMPRGVVLGLFQKLDFAGLDVSAADRTHMTTGVWRELYEKGYYGVKTLRGYYDYTGKDKDQLFEDRDRELIKIFDMCQDYFKWHL